MQQIYSQGYFADVQPLTFNSWAELKPSPFAPSLPLSLPVLPQSLWLVAGELGLALRTSQVECQSRTFDLATQSRQGRQVDPSELQLASNADRELLWIWRLWLPRPCFNLVLLPLFRTNRTVLASKRSVKLLKSLCSLYLPLWLYGVPEMK